MRVATVVDPLNEYVEFQICIVPRCKKALKTKYRKRVIPLVSYAREAFKACPQGFTDYQDRPDALSSVLRKFYNDKNLLPAEDYWVFVQANFQDRLLTVNTPDRLRAELMVHKFHLPAYTTELLVPALKEFQICRLCFTRSA